MSVLKEAYNNRKCDKASKHLYHRIYEPIFQKLLNNKRIDILEIGVFKGASINAHLDFFEAHKYKGDLNIVGIDIFERVSRADVNNNINSDNVTLIKADSTLKEAASLLPKHTYFDLIIDDGAHDPISQAKTYCNFRPFLKHSDGASYVIEDVWPATKMWHPFVKDKAEFSIENFNSLIGTVAGGKIVDFSDQTGEPDSICLVETTKWSVKRKEKYR